MSPPVLLLAAALLAAPAAGTPPPLSSAHPADSVDARRRARDAQARFERIRVRHLPVTVAWGGSGCDDQVGRMCWRHGTGGTWSPEPEDTAVVVARAELLETLAVVAGEIPGDGWVLGQRVWYLGEAGRWDEAAGVARRCGTPEVWWCEALEGLTLHARGRWEDAEASFHRALELMDEGRRARWRDPEWLLDGDGRDALDDARGEGREEPWLRRLWAYADPLWLEPGNDRLTEHHARRTVALLREGAANPHGISWGSDLEQLLVRYGWEVGWERVAPSPSSISSREGTIGHEDPASRSFVPPGELLRTPLGRPPGAWVPELAYARSAYAPAYAPVFLPAAAELSVLPLGDSAAVVAAFVLPEDTVRDGRAAAAERSGNRTRGRSQLRAGLFLRSLDGAPLGEARMTGRDTVRLMVTVPAGAWVASAEILDADARLAGRHRVALSADTVVPDVPTLSDLLVLEGGGEPADLGEAVGRLLADLRVPAGGTVRVAWTVSGLGFRDEALGYVLSLVPAEQGFLRRAGEWLGLVDEERPQLLSWEEPSPRRTGPAFRSVALTLPDVEPGAWTLRLGLRTRGREMIVAERRIEVVAPSGSLDRRPGQR